MLASYEASAHLSRASRGREREAVVDQYLARVFAPSFRFGSGDITDLAGRRSGQMDVVVEYPFVPSLPAFASSDVRLYLAEGVAAAIEVKSDVAGQWPEVVATAKKLGALRREFGGMIVDARGGPLPRVPFFVVGFEGWSTPESVVRKLSEGPVDGILVIKHQICASPLAHPEKVTVGPLAMWWFISCLHWALTGIAAGRTEIFPYAR